VRDIDENVWKITFILLVLHSFSGESKNVLWASSIGTAGQAKKMTNGLNYYSNGDMRARPNPRKILTAGDWTVSNHLWNRLVILGKSREPVSCLAESWSKSHDGKEWAFQISPNLKWSDGSAMSIEQIKASIDLSIKGTTHSDLASNLDSFEISRKSGRNELIFKFKDVPRNFLINLASADFSITDGEVTLGEMAKRYSGPYIQSEASTNVEIHLKPNPHYRCSKLNPSSRSASIFSGLDGAELLTRLKSDPRGVAYLVGDTLDANQIESLRNSGRTIRNTPITEWSLQFGMSDRLTNELSLKDRQWFLRHIWETAEKDEALPGVLSWGIRPPGRFGSVTQETWRGLMKKLPLARSSAFPKRKLRFLVLKSFYELNLGPKKMEALLKRAGLDFETVLFDVKLSDSKEFQYLKRDDYDLILLYGGFDDPDPDGMWRYVQKWVPKSAHFLTDQDYRDAVTESNSDRRAELYRRFEEKHAMNPTQFVVRNLGNIAVFGPDLNVDNYDLNEWGLQLWRIR
jgi:hypothetical protein